MRSLRIFLLPILLTAALLAASSALAQKINPETYEASIERLKDEFKILTREHHCRDADVERFIKDLNIEKRRLERDLKEDEQTLDTLLSVCPRTC
jgi:predicted RNase H-like nuclease (RuvC/YqgF family)